MLDADDPDLVLVAGGGIEVANDLDHPVDLVGQIRDDQRRVVRDDVAGCAFEADENLVRKVGCIEILEANQLGHVATVDGGLFVGAKDRKWREPRFGAVDHPQELAGCLDSQTEGVQGGEEESIRLLGRDELG